MKFLYKIFVIFIPVITVSWFSPSLFHLLYSLLIGTAIFLSIYFGIMGIKKKAFSAQTRRIVIILLVFLVPTAIIYCGQFTLPLLLIGVDIPPPDRVIKRNIFTNKCVGLYEDKVRWYYCGKKCSGIEYINAYKQSPWFPYAEKECLKNFNAYKKAKTLIRKQTDLYNFFMVGIGYGLPSYLIIDSDLGLEDCDCLCGINSYYDYEQCVTQIAQYYKDYSVCEAILRSDCKLSKYTTREKAYGNCYMRVNQFHYRFPQISGALWPRQVIDVKSGDTIVVQNISNDKTKIIALYGIYTPQNYEPYGNSAKEYLSKKVQGKIVKLKLAGSLSDGRTLAFVYVDDEFLSEMLVRAGMAKVSQHCGKYICERLKKAENEARLSQRGLWMK